MGLIVLGKQHGFLLKTLAWYRQSSVGVYLQGKYLEEGHFLTPESSEKFRAPGENRTHDPPSSSADALTTELLEALWRAGSKFKYNYTSHRELYQTKTVQYDFEEGDC